MHYCIKHYKIMFKLLSENNLPPYALTKRERILTIDVKTTDLFIFQSQVRMKTLLVFLLF